MKIFFIELFCTISIKIYCQDNYEIQAYAAPTQASKTTMVELHSNYTFEGEQDIVDGVRPSCHALHETVEITTGITDNYEIGAYLFTNYTSGYGYQVVGSHIRPRVSAPEKWKLPIGLSLSAEIGYQKPTYSDDTWSLELRPIIDKKWSKFYISVNPTFGISLAGVFNNSTPVFEPNVKLCYQFFKSASFGFEYYGSTGYINMPENINVQQHAAFFAYDLEENKNWEVNIGIGEGLTAATDKRVGKVIIGRRINWKKNNTDTTK